jgi:hypothetical protein
MNPTRQTGSPAAGTWLRGSLAGLLVAAVFVVGFLLERGSTTPQPRPPSQQPDDPPVRPALQPARGPGATTGRALAWPPGAEAVPARIAAPTELTPVQREMLSDPAAENVVNRLLQELLHQTPRGAKRDCLAAEHRDLGVRIEMAWQVDSDSARATGSGIQANRIVEGPALSESELRCIVGAYPPSVTIQASKGEVFPRVRGEATFPLVMRPSARR